MSQTPSIDEIRARVSRKIESLDPGTPVASTVVFRLKRSEEARFEKSTDYLEKAATTLPGNIAFTFERGSEDSARDTVEYTSSGAWESAEAFRQYWESADLKHFLHGLEDFVVETPQAKFSFDGVSTGTSVLRTGQTDCWNTSGTAINCQGTGQDGDIRAGLPSPNPRFVDNTNGTVTDNLTGLTWLKDADTFGEVTWDQALINANGLVSGSPGLSDGSARGDWRLPNLRELLSLIDYGASNPIVTAGHPFTNVRSALYWTSTSLAPAPKLAWMMTLGIGPTVFDLKISASRMWPVRGRKGRVPRTGQKTCWDTHGVEIPAANTGQDGDIQAGVPFPTSRFIDNGDGTATDQLTTLVWLKNANPFGFRNWEQALKACNSLESGTHGLADNSVPGDWRLPNIREIESLVDYGNFGPSLPTGHPFTDVRPSSYWTSTSVSAAPTEAMFIILGVGPSIFENKEHPFFVWPVRDP